MEMKAWRKRTGRNEVLKRRGWNKCDPGGRGLEVVKPWRKGLE
jgi:hypothetical protein